MTHSYLWYAFDGSDGNDVCVERQGGRYIYHIHHLKYPDPPTSRRRFKTPLRAVEHARKQIAHWTPPFQ